MLAYNKIYAKPGNLTKGADGQTIDGISLERINDIINQLRNGTYKPNPARRTYILKKNGKKRPLGIPSIDDKLVQETTRMILESIWEDTFLHCSHGFRPQRSCHTALQQIQSTFNGVKWFVEGDISAYFDTIDHSILVRILRKRIKDERFIQLIWKFLKAGYLEDMQYHVTYSGTAQGSIISPILANIYLNELDKHMMEIKKSFDMGSARRRNSEHRKAEAQKYRIRKTYNPTWITLDRAEKSKIRKQVKALEQTMVNIPYADPFDTQYRRLSYVRYADDFLIGIIGSKNDALRIKDNIAKFLSDQLSLKLSAEKTLITHSAKRAKFLSFDITVARNNNPRRNSKGTLTRTHNYCVKLLIPKESWVKKLHAYEVIKIRPQTLNEPEKWHPIARNKIANKTDLEILQQYNQEVRGLYNYYRIANNASVLHKFNYFMYYSLLRTLAKKYKKSMKQIRIKYDIDGKLGVRYKAKNVERTMLYYHDGFRRDKSVKVNYENDIKIEYKYPFGRYSPAYKLKQGICELCKAVNVRILIHHVRKLNSLRADTPWNIRMLELKRKTLPVCEHCFGHIIHAS
ncbi:reverse transcriptase domain-containing protein [Desulfosporosinus acididurans]|uniref:reverse transcriptase domain-containing protein n=1 Tax=Desulfosporosinus acididurans TaxID=476652 RepID=UPI001FA7F634|nr:reverse transcriptase domain-containing protein [Desulfosporosinus acididurans]